MLPVSKSSTATLRARGEIIPTVTGVSTNNGNDAVLLKFDVNGNLLWERTWGGPASDQSLAVAATPDGSAYIAGTATSFGPSSSGLFVVKFDSLGNLVWQRISDGAEGNAVAVGFDGSVYAAGTTPRNQIGNFDLLALKITSGGDLIWQRTYASGEVVDPLRRKLRSGPRENRSVTFPGSPERPQARCRRARHDFSFCARRLPLALASSPTRFGPLIRA